MQAFEFYCPTKIYFGKGAEARVGEAVKHFGGTKVFIVYGGHSAVKSGLIARIEQTLTDAGLEHMSFGGVQPNPRLSHAREGVQKALAFGADFILGVGGGSVMDTSKAIAHGGCHRCGQSGNGHLGFLEQEGGAHQNEQARRGADHLRRRQRDERQRRAHER